MRERRGLDQGGPPREARASRHMGRSVDLYLGPPKGLKALRAEDNLLFKKGESFAPSWATHNSTESVEKRFTKKRTLKTAHSQMPHTHTPESLSCGYWAQAIVQGASGR